MGHMEPLTRYVGKAERTLQALLQTQLQQVGVAFPEWAALTFLRNAGPLKRSQLGEAIRNGRLVEAGGVDSLLDAMIDKGLIAQVPDGLAMTSAAKSLYDPLRSRVMEITALVEKGVPEDDLATTRQTLAFVTERAGKLLTDLKIQESTDKHTTAIS
ncbi:MAG TPA: hypothetical protein VFM22_08265 [Castellaniella sp.]|nr:hypothetical protein [Castellaniella sp.]